MTDPRFGPVNRNNAPVLLRYGLLLTTATYLLAALFTADAALPFPGGEAVRRTAFASVALSGAMLWVRPTLKWARAWHLAVPTALLTTSLAQTLVWLISTGAPITGEVAADITSLLYITIAQYVFLPMSIALKDGPRR